MPIHIRIRTAAAILAALVSVSALAACASGTQAVTNVSAADAAKVLAQPGITVIDVRTPAEYSSGHLASAINIDVEGSSFDQQVAALAKTNTYFVYCRSGNRSGVATAKMAGLGFAKVDNLEGGVIQWQAGGGALVTG